METFMEAETNNTPPLQADDGKSVRDILEEICPDEVNWYNEGLLPDEEGYSPEALRWKTCRREALDTAEAALGQLIATREQAVLDEYEQYLIDNAYHETSSSFDDEIRYSIGSWVMLEGKRAKLRQKEQGDAKGN
jgi:hypothetical protein